MDEGSLLTSEQIWIEKIIRDPNKSDMWVSQNTRLDKRKYCSTCGEHINVPARFCSSCGSPAATEAKHCRRCAALIEVGFKFCPSCGTATIPAEATSTSHYPLGDSLTVKKARIEQPRAQRDERIDFPTNYVKHFWNGNGSLAFSYWVLGVIGNLTLYLTVQSISSVIIISEVVALLLLAVIAH